MVVVEEDIMGTDKAECSIGRILPVRNPRCRENSNLRVRVALARAASFDLALPRISAKDSGRYSGYALRVT